MMFETCVERWILQAQSRQSARLSLQQSSELALPASHPQTSVAPTPLWF
jgi:hypothetical protein